MTKKDEKKKIEDGKITLPIKVVDDGILIPIKNGVPEFHNMHARGNLILSKDQIHAIIMCAYSYCQAIETSKNIMIAK